MNEIDVRYKMIDISNFSELNKNTLSQMHEILKNSANWNDSFLEFKKNYTKRNFQNTKLFLIFANKDLAGFIEGWVINKDQFYSKSFYMSPKYRNLNLGTKLRARTFAKLRSLGFKKFVEGFVVNDLVSKITKKIVIKRKSDSLKKQSKLTFPYSAKSKDVIFKNIRKRRSGKK